METKTSISSSRNNPCGFWLPTLGRFVTRHRIRKLLALIVGAALCGNWGLGATLNPDICLSWRFSSFDVTRRPLARDEAWSLHLPCPTVPSQATQTHTELGHWDRVLRSRSERSVVQGTSLWVFEVDRIARGMPQRLVGARVLLSVHHDVLLVWCRRVARSHRRAREDQGRRSAQLNNDTIL